MGGRDSRICVHVLVVCCVFSSVLRNGVLGQSLIGLGDLDDIVERDESSIRLYGSGFASSTEVGFTVDSGVCVDLVSTSFIKSLSSDSTTVCLMYTLPRKHCTTCACVIAIYQCLYTRVVRNINLCKLLQRVTSLCQCGLKLF